MGKWCTVEISGVIPEIPPCTYVHVVSVKTEAQKGNSLRQGIKLLLAMIQWKVAQWHSVSQSVSQSVLAQALNLNITGVLLKTTL